MTFGSRLKQLRQQMGLSQQELANRIGLNRSTYARYETDDNQADYQTLQKLADFFGTSVDYLLGRTSVARPTQPQSQASDPANSDLMAFIRDRRILYFGDERLELSAEEQSELLRHMRLAWLMIKEKRQEQESPKQEQRSRKKRNNPS